MLVSGSEKLEKGVRRLRDYQTEVREALGLHKRLLQELAAASEARGAEIRATAADLHGAIDRIQAELLAGLGGEVAEREAHFRARAGELEGGLAPLRLLLLAASVLAAASTQEDFLALADDLMRRMAQVHHFTTTSPLTAQAQRAGQRCRWQGRRLPRVCAPSTRPSWAWRGA